MYPMPIMRGVGAAVADARQAQLLSDLSLEVQGPLASAIQQMQNVAKYAPDLYPNLVDELNKLLVQADKLEQEINQVPVPLSEDTTRVLAKKLDVLAQPVEQLRLRVLDAGRAGVEQKQLHTAIWSVSIGMLTVGLGWWLWSRAKQRRRRG